MLRFSANISLMFGEVPFEARFRAAAEAGFEAVECQFPYDHDADRLAEARAAAGVAHVLLNAPPGDFAAGERGLAALPGRQAEFQEGLGCALDYAGALDCRLIHVLAGVAADPARKERMREVYIENLRFAAEAGAARDVVIVVEPLNDLDTPGYLLTRTADARRIIEQVGHPNLRLQYDLYHAQIMEGNLAATFAANLDVIAHVQVSSVPGRHEPDRGEINFPHMFDVIDGSGYRGWVGAEYRPAGETLAGLDWLRSLKER